MERRENVRSEETAMLRLIRNVLILRTVWKRLKRSRG
jgi:hypothetical protein